MSGYDMQSAAEDQADDLWTGLWGIGGIFTGAALGAGLSSLLLQTPLFNLNNGGLACLGAMTLGIAGLLMAGQPPKFLCRIFEETSSPASNLLQTSEPSFTPDIVPRSPAP